MHLLSTHGASGTRGMQKLFYKCEDIFGMIVRRDFEFEGGRYPGNVSAGIEARFRGDEQSILCKIKW